MDSRILYTIPALFFFLIPSVYAEEIGERTILINPDGTKKIQLSYDPNRILDDNGRYQDFLYNEDSNNIRIETGFGSISLDKNSCVFSFYPQGRINSSPLFTDSITPRISNQGSNEWSDIQQIIDASCAASWNGSELTAQKTVSNLGTLKYKYIINGIEWKTQLEATNLSDQTNKQFGFLQTIDLNRDTINFGGQSRFLDNFDGQTFDRIFLESNQARVFELLNGFNYDIDQGFDSLESVTIHDTGIDKSRLVFDYTRNPVVILPGETLIIDPTYSSTAGGSFTDIYNGGFTRAGINVRTASSVLVGINIDSVTWYLDKNGSPTGTGTTKVYNSGGTLQYTFDTNLDVSTLTTSPTGYNFTGSYTVNTGDRIVFEYTGGDASNHVDMEYNPVGTFNGTDTALCLFDGAWDCSPTYDAYDYKFDILYNDSDPEAIMTQTVENVGDIYKITGTINIQDANADITRIVTRINGTIINNNSTDHNSTSFPYTISFGPIWEQITVDGMRNVTSTVSFQNNLWDNFANETKDYKAREYDPEYFTAVVASEGGVNYTKDGATLKVNRDKSGSTFNIECSASAHGDVFAINFNKSHIPTKTWYNFSSVGFFKQNIANSGPQFVECYNDNLLFSTSMYGNNTLALGVGLFDEIGGVFGLPAVSFLLLAVFSMATNRNFPTILVIGLGTAGILGSLGLLTLTGGVWGLILVIGAIGILSLRKAF